MGLHLPGTRETTGEPLNPSITWREYSSALASVTPSGDIRGGTLALGAPMPPDRGHGVDETTSAVLAARIRRRPRDPAAHRMLGLAHLAAGRDAAAVRHLETAYRLVGCDARLAVGLPEALRVQCEAALLRLALMGLYTRLGRADRAYSLAREAQAIL
jgi:hypothetical protein